MSDGNLHALIKSVVKSGPISVVSMPLIAKRINRIVEYRRRLVQTAHSLAWYLDVMLVDGQQAAQACKEVAVFLVERAGHESNLSKVYGAIRGK